MLDATSIILENDSIMTEAGRQAVVADADINQRIARRVAALRASQGLSLDALAMQSGVSRSTISLIERGETSATAVVLEKLAGRRAIACRGAAR